MDEADRIFNAVRAVDERLADLWRENDRLRSERDSLAAKVAELEALLVAKITDFDSKATHALLSRLSSVEAERDRVIEECAKVAGAVLKGCGSFIIADVEVPKAIRALKGGRDG